MFVPFPFGAQLSGGFLVRSSHSRPQSRSTVPVPPEVRGWCAVPRATVLGISSGYPRPARCSERLWVQWRIQH